MINIGWKHKYKNSNKFLLMPKGRLGGKTQIKLEKSQNYTVDSLIRELAREYVKDRVDHYELAEEDYDKFFKNSKIEIGDFDENMIQSFGSGGGKERSFWEWGKKNSLASSGHYIYTLRRNMLLQKHHVV